MTAYLPESLGNPGANHLHWLFVPSPTQLLQHLLQDGLRVVVEVLLIPDPRKHVELQRTVEVGNTHRLLKVPFDHRLKVNVLPQAGAEE